MSDIKYPLKVFLCHSHSDKDTVKALYDRLVKDGLDAWLDKEKLLPGQGWQIEIQKAVRGADVVVVCHSKQFNREGFRQREVKWALDAAMEKPEGEIFVIPARLEECEVLDSLSEWQWVDLFEPDGYEMLLRGLRVRAESIGATLRVEESRRLGKSPAIVKTERDIGEGKAPTSLPAKLPLEQAGTSVKDTPPASPLEMPSVNQNVTDVVVEKPQISAKGAEKPYKLRTEYVVAIIGAAATIIAALLGSPYIGRWFSPTSVSTTSGTIRVQASLTNTFVEVPVVTDTFSPTEKLTSTTLLPTEITDPTGVEMVLVAWGEFTMGSDGGEADEQPPHTIFLDHYYIDKYEVTNALYKVCVDTGECKEPLDPGNYYNPKYEQHPVIYVDWNMAKEYCEWRGARLPTEAEWEKAARGTDGHTYPWGEEIDCTYANYQGQPDKYCIGATTAVGSYESGRSPYGAYDMAGNVWEWVADRYAENYYASSLEQNPLGPESGVRVLRGGSWYNLPDNVRSANRLNNSPGKSNDHFGFRCARSPWF